MDLNRRLTLAADLTRGYFTRQLQHIEVYPEVSDIACFYKHPMMYLSAHDTAAAQQLLAAILSRFMQGDGDFKTSHAFKSEKLEYVEYWAYTNGWICRAARQVGYSDIVKPGLIYLEQYSAPNALGFLTNHIVQQNGITDVLTTAHLGLLALECGDQLRAEAAGEYCAELLAKQELAHGCYLRLDAKQQLVTSFAEDMEIFHHVKVNVPDQFYFMLAYPIAFLVLLYEQTQQTKYLDIARTYLNFTLSCQNPTTSNYSHKLAWAMTLFYKHDRQTTYRNALESICHHFLRQQASNGLWYTDDIDTAYDQSAEICYWFQEIHKIMVEIE